MKIPKERLLLNLTIFLLYLTFPYLQHYMAERIKSPNLVECIKTKNNITGPFCSKQ